MVRFSGDRRIPWPELRRAVPAACTPRCLPFRRSSSAVIVVCIVLESFVPTVWSGFLRFSASQVLVLSVSSVHLGIVCAASDADLPCFGFLDVLGCDTVSALLLLL